MHLSGSRLVFLVDNSASMQATDVVTRFGARPSGRGQTPRERADRANALRQLGHAHQFSDTARVEQTFTDDRQQLRQALAAIRPSQHPTNLSEALKLAAGLVNPGQANDKPTDLNVAGTKLFIFSDGRFPDVENFELGNLEPTFVPIGSDLAANVGIVAFGVSLAEDGAPGTPGRGKLQAFARLKNYGPTETDVLLKLFVNDQAHPSDAGHLAIPQGDTRGLVFDLPDFDSGILHVKAETGDQLAVDDEAWTVVSPPRRARVLLISPENEQLKFVLTTKTAAEVAKVEVETPAFLDSTTYKDQVDLGVWDLVIYDRASPKTMPRTNTFFIGCLPPGGVWKAQPEVILPQIINAAVSHRLMQLVDYFEIQKVITATPLVVPSGGTVLIDSDRGPLLAIAPREGFEDLVLGMALVEERTAADGSRAVYRNTDWPWRVSFASFMLQPPHRPGRGPGSGGRGHLSTRHALDPGCPRFQYGVGRSDAFWGHGTLAARSIG